jgi:hypothetical protein
MELSSVLMDRWNQHSKNGYTTERNQMFKAMSIKIPMTFNTEIEKTYPKVHLETQETANSQGNTQQKEQHWRYHNT